MLLTFVLTGVVSTMCTCARVPADIKLYFASSHNLKQGNDGKWLDLYLLDRGGPQVINAFAYDSANEILAVSLGDRLLSKGSARILMIDPATHKILREIKTGMDQIRKIAFDREGKRLAIIVKQFNSGLLKLCVLSLENESFSVITDGDLNEVSWGKDDEVFLSYKEGEKKFVGSINIGLNNGINKIAEGLSISASDIRDAFVYIDVSGQIIFSERGGVTKALPVPSKFQDSRFLSHVKFVHGSDSIIIAKYSVTWDNLYLLRVPYKDSQMILDRGNFMGYEATESYN